MLASASRLHSVWGPYRHRWPFRKIDGPGKGKTPSKPVPSIVNETNLKGTHMLTGVYFFGGVGRVRWANCPQTALGCIPVLAQIAIHFDCASHKKWVVRSRHGARMHAFR